jgi:ABC-type transport system substrate-binding protein
MRPERLRAAVSTGFVLIMMACGSAQPELTSPPESVPPEIAETMIVGVHIPPSQALGSDFGITPTDLPLHSLHPNGSLWDSVVRRFVYSGVYRLDATQSAVPDLAVEPCAVSTDLLVITCTLREAQFHDGMRVTADDVAFSYQLILSDACRMGLWCADPELDRVAGATAIDERTVEFRLAEPLPAFITSFLPDLLIEPRARVEDAFAEFTQAANGADPESLRAIATRLEAALHPNGAVECEPPSEDVLAEAQEVLTAIGRALRSREPYAIGPGGAFDACAYGDYLVRAVTGAADGLSMNGVDAMSAAYPILEFPLPVGSGPWRVVSIEPGETMALEAFDAFQRGKPATARLEVRILRSTAEAIDAVRSGAVHWLLEPFATGENLIADGIGNAPGVVWVEYNQLSYFDLEYNLREGRLFADPNLREAIEVCIDKDETVAAATGGDGVPIYSPISPSMWAFEPDLPRPERNVESGRALIEASGWTRGPDGIYETGDRRLSTTVPVLQDLPEAVRFVELLAFQVRDCGIELIPRPMPLDDLITAVTWPLIPPGADQPWDAVFAGWFSTADPDFSSIYDSSAIATASNPDGFNYIGYDSAESDRILEQARSTYEQPARARLYRQHQELLAEDRPVLFGWSPRIREARSERLGSSAGTLATDTRTWWWQLETIFLRSPEPPP